MCGWDTHDGWDPHDVHTLCNPTWYMWTLSTGFPSPPQDAAELVYRQVADMLEEAQGDADGGSGGNAGGSAGEGADGQGSGGNGSIGGGGGANAGGQGSGSGGGGDAGGAGTWLSGALRGDSRMLSKHKAGSEIQQWI